MAAASPNEAPLIVVAGPTASGKTALALRLAEALGGEIVSCDSVAVYRGMDIGAAKPTAGERACVPHHCLDLYDPDEACTAGDWARHARAAIEDIRSRQRLPIVAGGTGLYLRALLDGLAPAPPRNEALRDRLRIRSAERLHRLLRRLDPAAAQAIHANDVPKVIRSLEVTLTARQPQTEQWKQGRDALSGFRVLRLGLTPPRETLYARINARCEWMFANGLLEETAALRAQFGDGCRALGSLGYAQATQVLRRETTLPEAVTNAQQGHRNYAKRQGTWFRREPEMHWLGGTGDEPGIQGEALARVTSPRWRPAKINLPQSWLLVSLHFASNGRVTESRHADSCHHASPREARRRSRNGDARGARSDDWGHRCTGCGGDRVGVRHRLAHLSLGRVGAGAHQAAVYAGA